MANWQNITSDTEISTTARGATIEFDAPPQHVPKPNVRFSFEETAIINNEEDIIDTTPHRKGEVLSSIFVRPNKDGSYRLILNLKGLNQYVIYHHFKMVTLYPMLKLVEKDCYLAFLDLKDAYYLVAVKVSDSKYLHFMWNKTLYQFTYLPYGLSSQGNLRNLVKVET